MNDLVGILNDVLRGTDEGSRIAVKRSLQANQQ